MNPKTKIYLSIAAITAIVIVTVTIWQSHKMASLEKSVDETKLLADQKRDAAAQKEIESAESKQKIDYLEQSIANINKQTRKQDEELEKSITNSSLARGRVERAKRVRTIPANTVELCAKLAEPGHACEGS
jgi:predicted  nucleic acid-binding Zn-ribbon protein